MGGDCDLHLHSNFSDGTDTPEQVVGRARREGLRALALTDHDTMAGVARFGAAAAAAGIETLAGIEITAEVEGREVHILGYGLRTDDEAMRRELEDQQRHRSTRVDRILEKLRAEGVDLTLEEVKDVGVKGVLTRPHVALALVRRQVVRTVDEAFHRYLGRGGSAFVEKPRLTVARAIRLIREAGGVAVLAHPGISNVDRHIPRMVQEGLQGIEVWHSKHEERDSVRYLRVAQERGLLATGGSDCHGMTKGAELMGGVRLPYGRFEAIKELAPGAKAR